MSNFQKFLKKLIFWPPGTPTNSQKLFFLPFSDSPRLPESFEYHMSNFQKFLKKLIFWPPGHPGKIFGDPGSKFGPRQSIPGWEKPIGICFQPILTPKTTPNPYPKIHTPKKLRLATLRTQVFFNSGCPQAIKTTPKVSYAPDPQSIPVWAQSGITAKTFPMTTLLQRHTLR
jgi:hypothetical protein